MPRGIYKRNTSKAKKRLNEIPLDAIPERAAPRGRGGKAPVARNRVQQELALEIVRLLNKVLP